MTTTMITVATAATKATSQGFLDAAKIWLLKPHVINRRLCGSRIVWERTVAAAKGDLQIFLAAIQNLKSNGSNFDDPSFLAVVKSDEPSEGLSTRELKMYLRDLLPRQVQRFYILREIIIYDECRNRVTYVPLVHMKNDGELYKCGEESEDVAAGDVTYCLQLDLERSRISVEVSNTDLLPSKESLACSVTWLKEILLPKLARWGGEEVLNTEVTSLRLVPVDQYNQLYQDLKAKHGPRLVEMWPECTDPQKFVFEDIAIATYLLIIWEEERQKKGITQKQSFVDLGCGNGLLVHILSLEGHPGLGVDVRKRKIWDMYGESTKLHEQAISPSGETLFPEYDWLIGNHSDELTPWIPVMAARSSYRCNFFVLPCCPHDFVGKFRHKEHRVSQYRSYIKYVSQLGTKCGFQMEEDILRIPSTKRVCFIGRSRTYLEETEAEADSQRKEFIEERCKSQSKQSGSGLVKKRPCDPATPESCDCTLEAGTNQETVNACCHGDASSVANGMAASSTPDTAPWAENFQPRERVEKTRNCVSLDNELKDRMIRTVFEALIHAADSETIVAEDGGEWNKGGRLPLSEVVQLFDQSTMLQLKSECGGLQTLLRNAHFVFLVRGGTVELRDWTNDDHINHQGAKKKRKGQHGKADSASRTKTRLCFFFENHPDGCPLSAENCRFAHGADEMRTFEPGCQPSESLL